MFGSVVRSCSRYIPDSERAGSSRGYRQGLYRRGIRSTQVQFTCPRVVKRLPRFLLGSSGHLAPFFTLRSVNPIFAGSFLQGLIVPERN